MNDNLKKVLDAARSGEYCQTRGKLHRVVDGKDCYCFLGVACKVYQDETGDGDFDDSGLDYITNEPHPNDTFYNAPLSVLNWLGIFDPSGEADRRIVRLNDAEQLPLSAIADMIEEEYASKVG